MNTRTIRRTPWTCRFGRFGVTVEPLGSEASRVDDVFWACCQPARTTAARMTTRGECERCPWWEASARFAGSVD
jgi:hypothetical protein